MRNAMTIPIVPCPLCQDKGSVPYQASTTEPTCTTRCPLCWGLGCIPVLEVVNEGRNTLALHYWLCDCAEPDQRIHPSNHDVCLACNLMEDDARMAPAEDVQVFFQESFGVRLDCVGMS